MLSDRLCELLTAYVDGELNARQRKAVLRLLRRSAEARTLLRTLQTDADQLRQLPRRRLDADLAPRLLETIRERKLSVKRPGAARPASFPAWYGVAAAAAVLLVISAASFLYFSLSATHGTNPAAHTAHTDNPERPADPGPMPQQPTLPDTRLAQVPPREMLPAPQPDGLAQNAAPEEEPRGPVPPPKDSNLEALHAVPTPKLELFPEIIDARLTLILNLSDLDQPRPWQQLRDELQKDPGYRVELGCVESSKAIDRLRTAFRAQGIRLVVDQAAQDRLKLRLRTNYALYLENLSRDEAARILRQLGADDKKPKLPRQFDKVVVSRMTENDDREVANLLGIDRKQLDAPQPRTPRDVDLHQPLSKTTAEQVERSLLGQGAPRPEPGKSAGKTPERLAVVMAYNPVRPRPGSSKEVSQFLDQRKERQPNTVRLVLVLRGSRG